LGKTDHETKLLTKTFAYPIWFKSYRTNRGRYNQNPEQICPTELNTNKALLIILSIIVDNYIPLRQKKIKERYFSPLQPPKNAFSP